MWLLDDRDKVHLSLEDEEERVLEVDKLDIVVNIKIVIRWIL